MRSMGTNGQRQNGSSNGRVAATGPGGKALVTNDRRRLSVGNLQPGEEGSRTRGDSKDGNAAPEDPRGLVRFLKSKSVLDFANGAKRRGSFSIGGVTTTDQDSFNEKKNVTEGEEDVTAQMLKGNGLGIACRKGLKPETPNQDSFAFIHADGDYNLYGVFDGHGINGHDVSNFVREILPKLFMSDPNRDTNTKQAFLDCFAKTQQMVEEDKTIDCRTSGCTATLAYQRAESDDLWVAHCGDSRAILITDSKGSPGVELTVDHKPNTPAERKRIEERGGCVIFDGFYNHRVFKRGTVYPGLNMSRALGDMLGNKEAGIVETPDVKCISLNGKQTVLALCLCTDGVWEFIENDEAAQIVLSCRDPVSRKIDPILAADTLAKESWNRWMQDTGSEICDDITVMIQLYDRK